LPPKPKNRKNRFAERNPRQQRIRSSHWVMIEGRLDGRLRGEAKPAQAAESSRNAKKGPAHQKRTIRGPRTRTCSEKSRFPVPRQGLRLVSGNNLKVRQKNRICPLEPGGLRFMGHQVHYPRQNPPRARRKEERTHMAVREKRITANPRFSRRGAPGWGRRQKYVSEQRHQDRSAPWKTWEGKGQESREGV